MQWDVLGLGVSTLDVLSLVVDFPAGEGVQRAAQITVQGGGPVATAVVTAACLGARTAMIDCLGDDWRGELILAEYRQAGVQTDYLRIAPGCASAVASIWVRQADGARAIAYSPGSTPELTPAELPAAVLAQTGILHLNGRHLEAGLHACRLVQQAGGRVSFDGGANRYRPELRALLPLTDICIVALDFARQYTGLADIIGAARALLAEGPALVAVTDGLRGSWVFSRHGEPFHQPAFPVADGVDTTGCGDTYHGAFLFGLSRGLPLTTCARLASKTAAHTCRFLGGRGGLATLSQWDVLAG